MLNFLRQTTLYVFCFVCWTGGKYNRSRAKSVFHKICFSGCDIILREKVSPRQVVFDVWLRWGAVGTSYTYHLNYEHKWQVVCAGCDADLSVRIPVAGCMACVSSPSLSWILVQDLLTKQKLAICQIETSNFSFVKSIFGAKLSAIFSDCHWHIEVYLSIVSVQPMRPLRSV